MKNALAFVSLLLVAASSRAADPVYLDQLIESPLTTLQNQFQLLLAGRQTPAGMAKAVQDDWTKFDKTLGS